MGAFEDALSDFVKNFAYTDSILHLVRRGYSVDRIIRENRVPLPREEIERIIEKNKDKLEQKDK